MDNTKNTNLMPLKSLLKEEVLQMIVKAFNNPTEVLYSPIKNSPGWPKTDYKKASLAGAFVALFILDPLGIQSSQWKIMEKEFDQDELQELCEVLGQNLSSTMR